MMTKVHPANRILRYLEKDDQLEMTINSIEADPDFRALSEMNPGQLQGEIKEIEPRLAKTIAGAQRMAGPAVGRSPADRNRHFDNAQQRVADDRRFYFSNR